MELSDTEGWGGCWYWEWGRATEISLKERFKLSTSEDVKGELATG